MIDKFKAFYHRKPWSGRFIIALFIFSLLLIIARVALSPGIIYGTTSWLKKQGIDASIEAVDINIFDGTVTLKKAVGNKNGRPLFQIGLIDLHWQWRPLSNKTIKITRIALDSINVSIRQYHDAIIIGGVSIPLKKTVGETPENINKKATDENVKTWAAALGEVSFTNLNICYQQSTASLAQATAESKFIDYCFALEKMSWAGTISYATDTELLKTDDVPLTSTGDFTLEGLNIIDNRLNRPLLSSKSNTLNNVTIYGLNNIHIDQLTMHDLSLLQRDDKKHIDSLRFQQLTINDIKLSRLNTLSINDISISKPGVYLVKQNPSDWEYQQWMPQSSANNPSSKKSSEEKPAEESTAFKFTLNNLTISDPDLCYLDKEQSLYYCLTASDLNWKGKLQYNSYASKQGAPNIQAEGNLTLLQPNIRNHNIQRDLLNFKKLTLTKVKITGNNILVDKFKLNELAALQRSKQNKDYTLSFNNLIIDNLKYAGEKIAINTLSLKGLASTVSKNKDGNWEFDKWLVTKSSKTTGSSNDTIKQKLPTKNKKPLAITINDLNITTDEKIIFTDNSTQPAMKIGLNSLTFDAKKIATDKPDTNSTFKLFAKTTRHGTINIEGSAKPFAKKISFDATGKLKGFDLRAATPAIRKAIGHIIQSGQLDADLKLHAVDGVLDSNIALALYQFNIKAIDKESAKKLDAKFGMPLNQTLVLLRDKDDSIHLDIPITGDINSPNFNPMDAIIKATSKAATVTLITFYTPYGLIYAGGNIAFDLATALNFDPVKFTPGSAEINSGGKEQLDKLSKLLSKKPQIHLTLCGVTNQQDVFALYPGLKEKLANNKAEIKLTDKQLLQLSQLARERQINSKNYLVKQRGIEHDRLILCAPEHKSKKDAVAGVEIII